MRLVWAPYMRLVASSMFFIGGAALRPTHRLLGAASRRLPRPLRRETSVIAGSKGFSPEEWPAAKVKANRNAKQSLCPGLPAAPSHRSIVRGRDNRPQILSLPSVDLACCTGDATVTRTHRGRFARLSLTSLPTSTATRGTRLRRWCLTTTPRCCSPTRE